MLSRSSSRKKQQSSNQKTVAARNTCLLHPLRTIHIAKTSLIITFIDYNNNHTQLTFTWSKTTIETLEKGVKCVQN